MPFALNILYSSLLYPPPPPFFFRYQFRYRILNEYRSLSRFFVDLFRFGQVLYIALIFYLLGDVAESFFCPALTKLAQLLRLPPNVAISFLSSFLLRIFSSSLSFFILS